VEDGGKTAHECTVSTFIPPQPSRLRRGTTGAHEHRHDVAPRETTFGTARTGGRQHARHPPSRTKVDLPGPQPPRRSPSSPAAAPPRLPVAQVQYTHHSAYPSTCMQAQNGPYVRHSLRLGRTSAPSAGRRHATEVSHRYRSHCLPNCPAHCSRFPRVPTKTCPINRSTWRIWTAGRGP
jgi:hypothetical protein